MKKKHLLLLLGSLLLGGLIGMFGATFTNLHLNISQEQVQFILTTIFFCLGILSTMVALYFIMNSRKAYDSYLAEEDDELNELAYIKMYRSLDYGTVFCKLVCFLAWLQCCLATIYRYQLFS